MTNGSAVALRRPATSGLPNGVR